MTQRKDMRAFRNIYFTKKQFPIRHWNAYYTYSVNMLVKKERLTMAPTTAYRATTIDCSVRRARVNHLKSVHCRPRYRLTVKPVKWTTITIVNNRICTREELRLNTISQEAMSALCHSGRVPSLVPSHLYVESKQRIKFKLCLPHWLALGSTYRSGCCCLRRLRLSRRKHVVQLAWCWHMCMWNTICNSITSWQVWEDNVVELEITLKTATDSHSGQQTLW